MFSLNFYFFDISLDFSRTHYQNNKHNGICMLQTLTAFNQVLSIKRFSTCLRVVNNLLTVFHCEIADSHIHCLIIAPHIKGVFSIRFQFRALDWLLCCISTVTQLFAQIVVYMINPWHRARNLCIPPWYSHYFWR